MTRKIWLHNDVVRDDIFPIALHLLTHCWEKVHNVITANNLPTMPVTLSDENISTKVAVVFVFMAFNRTGLYQNGQSIWTYILRFTRSWPLSTQAKAT